MGSSAWPAAAAPRPEGPAWLVVGASADGAAVAVEVAADGTRAPAAPLDETALTILAADDAVRWVWSDTTAWYPQLLRRGVTVRRAHDLRLCHAILRRSALIGDPARLRAATRWDAAPDAAPSRRPSEALFDLDCSGGGGEDAPLGIAETLDEFDRQRDALASTAHAARLRLLLAAESAGALIAVELQSAGLPWDVDEHDRILRSSLGARPAPGGTPGILAEAAARVRVALGDPALSLESQPRLLRALHRAGIPVDSTGRAELAAHDHPVIAPLLAYKKLARLAAANGWAWLDEWVHDGRFRPVYVPGGVVTGRWASSGGGALQLPRQLRSAVRADSGWKLIVADVAQLEPRVLAAMAGDSAMADAARGRDLYSGIVQRGAVASRSEAKAAVLGAMYGATTGTSGRLVPRLRRVFPRAMRLVDDAASTGEGGGSVTTWLGRTSPAPDTSWHDAQARAADVDASAEARARARRDARDRGRFTRNFVVQGTAAEWSLCWLAELRRRLAELPLVPESAAAPRSGLAFARRPHLAFFLHDEVIVHAPAELAEQAAECVRESAASAGRLLFGDFPLDFPLDLRITESAEK